MSKLDNCPFCGSDKVNMTSIAKNQYGKRTVKYQGLCHKCYARGPIVTVTFNPRIASQADIKIELEQAQYEAAQLWNQRHIPEYDDCCQ